ncbi:MAG: GatB/YqeY domain-containing protein [bacterium]
MSLKETISEDLKQAMKSGDKLRLETIRSIRALILEYEKSGAKTAMSSDDELALLNSVAKKRKESIEQFEKGNRPDLAEKEKLELNIILTYLPKQLNEEELTDEIKKLAAEINAVTKSDFPKLMQLASKTFKGRADGKVIKSIIDKLLG